MTTRNGLRFARLADAEAIAAIYAPFVAGTHVSFEEVAPTAAVMRDRLAAAADRYPWIVYDRNDEIAGYAYASAHRARAAYRWSVDVSAYVHERHRRGGVARASYEALFALLAVQGYYNAFAGVTLPNDASIALHRSLGFTTIGSYRDVGFKAGAWHDTQWFQRPLRALEDPPGEPQSLAALPPALLARFLKPD